MRGLIITAVVLIGVPLLVKLYVVYIKDIINEIRKKK